MANYSCKQFSLRPTC